LRAVINRDRRGQGPREARVAGVGEAGFVDDLNSRAPAVVVAHGLGGVVEPTVREAIAIYAPGSRERGGPEYVADDVEVVAEVFQLDRGQVVRRRRVRHRQPIAKQRVVAGRAKVAIRDDAHGNVALEEIEEVVRAVVEVEVRKRDGGV